MKKRNFEYTKESIELLGLRFKLLGEPTRIRLLLELANGEKCVKDLVDEIGTGQANISKHLSLMTKDGMVNRRKEGLHVFYSIASDQIYDVIVLTYKSINSNLKEYQKALK